MVAAALAIAAAVGGVAYWLSAQAGQASTEASPAKLAAKSATAAPAAPVHLAVVATRDVALLIPGLGTVQPLNTVTVRSRVDGQVEAILFQEGQDVREGDVLVKIDAAPFQAALSQATAKLAQDTANLKNAKQDLERTQGLSKNGYATLQLLDQRVAAVAQLEAQVLADTAAIEAAKVQLAYTTITAPISGRIGFRLVDKGNIVHAADLTGMLTINQVTPISVVFTAPEQELPAIGAALKAGPPTVLAYSSDGKKQLAQGTLELIDNQIDVATGTIRLKAKFPNTDMTLWPGLSVSTKLRVGTLGQVIAVPDSAVQRGPNGLFAYIAGTDDKAVLRPLKVGRVADDLAVIEDGLAVGERLVTSGHYRVQPGARLQVMSEPQKEIRPLASQADPTIKAE